MQSFAQFFFHHFCTLWAVTVRNCQNPILIMSHIFHNRICHLHQCFVHASRLSKLFNGAFWCGSHNRLDLQSRCQNCLHMAETAVLSKSIQGLQYKPGFLLRNISFHMLYHLFKTHARFFTFLNLQTNQCLSHRCGTGIEYIRFLLRMFLQKQVLSKFCTVVRTTQF